MAEAFPETPFNGSSLETPTSNDVSVDASRWYPEQHTSIPPSNSSGTTPTLTNTQATLPGTSSKRYDGVFVYHKMEGKTASKIMDKIQEYVRSGRHPPKEIQLELYGDVKSTGVYECIEDICKLSDKIVLVWTPRCEEDKQCQEMIKSLKAYKCYTGVSDIIVVFYGFTNDRKPAEQNIFLCDTIPVEFEETDFFFKTMEKRLLQKNNRQPSAYPPHQQSRGAESREKSGQPASLSAELRPLGGLVNTDTLPKHVASSDQTPDSALPYDVMSDSGSRSVSTLTGPQDHMAHVSSALAMGGSRETSQSVEEPPTNTFKTTSSKNLYTTLPDSSNIMNRTESKDGSYNNESDQKESQEEDAPEMGTGVNQSLTRAVMNTGEQAEGQIHETRSSAFIQQAGDATNFTIIIRSQTEGFSEEHGHREEKRQSEKLQLSQTKTEKKAAMEGQPVKDPANERNTKKSTNSTTFTSDLQRSTLETQKVTSDSESGSHICKEGLSPSTKKTKGDSCETSANAKKHSQNAKKHSQSLDMNTSNGKSQMKQSSEPQLPETRHSSLTHAVVSARSGASNMRQTRDQETESCIRNSVKADRNTDRQGRGAEPVLEETAEEVGVVTCETSLSEETGLKSPFHSHSFGQAINNDTESEIKQEILAKQKYHVDFQDSFEMSSQHPPVSIQDDIITLQGDMTSSSSSTMEARGECSAQQVRDDDSLDKLPYIDCDYNNSLQCEVDMLDIISKPTVENYQRTGLDHFREEVPLLRLHTDSMSTEHEQTTLSGIQSSTGFEVQTTSSLDGIIHDIHANGDSMSTEHKQITLSGIQSSTGFQVQNTSSLEGIIHDIHPNDQASTRDDLKGFKSLQKPSLPPEEDKFSDNKLNYTQPIQESQPPGYSPSAAESGGFIHTTLVHTESGGHHSASAVTQSTMTSQPSSPTGRDVPNVTVINIAHSNCLYVSGAARLDGPSGKPMTEPGSSQPALPLGSDVTPARDGATPDPFRGEMDLQPDMEEIPSSKRSKGPKFFKLFCCGAQKRKNRKK